MKIILLKNVPNLGKAGDIKEVSGGYARNFLLPKGLAELATKHSIVVLAAQKQKREKFKKLDVRSKKSEAAKLAGKEFVLSAKTDDKGSLYEKISAKTIASELQKQGYKIEAKEVKLEKPIKKTGEYRVGLELAGEKAVVKLKVERKVN